MYYNYNYNYNYKFNCIIIIDHGSRPLQTKEIFGNSIFI